MEAHDRIAPVIVKAEYYDYKGDSILDTLEITFSEAINETNKPNPFFFRIPNSDTSYYAYLHQVSLNDQKAKFYIEYLKGLKGEEVLAIKNEDSVWINPNLNENIYDLKMNNQNNPANVRCLVNVVEVFVPLTFTINATNPISITNGIQIPNEIINDPIIRVQTEDLSSANGGRYYGSVIIIKIANPERIDEYDSFKANFSIFDALGNHIIYNSEMAYFNGNNNKEDIYLAYVWNGRNSSRRFAGSGNYLGVAKVTHLNNNSLVRKQMLKVIIGVKKDQ